MWKVIKEMVTSKKFIAMVIGGIASMVGHFWPELQEPTQNFLYAVIAYILGQGLADFGKSAPEKVTK